MSKLSVTLLSAGILIGLVVFGLFRFVSVDDLVACGDKPTVGGCVSADAIVVVSGGDTKARTDEAVKLFNNGWAPYLLVSGAAADPTGPSNASEMRNQAIRAGVPVAAIFSDETAQNTSENASGAAKLARERDIRNIIVVTSPYHLSRTKIVFGKAFADFGTVRAHPSHFDNNWPSDWWLTGRGWWLVSSELVKSVAELMKGSLKND